MSRIFGPIRQLGYVTRDLRVALRHWIDVAGIGPWFVLDRFEIPEFRYEGGVYSDFGASFAWAHDGELEIELIQQRSDTPSMILDFLSAHPVLPPEGLLQHWGTWPDDYDGVLRRAREAGCLPGHGGRSSRNNRFDYFRFGPASTAGIEITEVSPEFLAFRSMVREAARTWDGRDPIRRLPS
jgi:hypothetical protein